MSKKKQFAFKDWSTQLEKVWGLKTETDCNKFSDLMYSLNGTENIAFVEKLIDTVRLKDDNGLYEALHNAIWVFPKQTVGQLLARRLPEFQKRMGKHDQVLRFYLPLPHNAKALNSFFEEAKKWAAPDKRTALSAIKKWSVEVPEWEKILERFEKPVAKPNEDLIPEEWNDKWKKRLTKGRKDNNDYCISQLVWRGTKKNWEEDLDFVVELIALNHGKHWRQVNNMTTPLWGYAHKILYNDFVSKVKKLPEAKRNKLLDNIKKVNKHKYAALTNDLTKKI
jgi:hypothetical protein